MHYDGGDYAAAVRLCAQLLDLPGVRARQKQSEPDARLIGIGFASFTEQTAHGAAEFAARGAAIIPGYESCTARILTDGSAVLMVGIQSHGQGLETTLSQIAAQELGIDPVRIAVRHGDTESTAFGFSEILDFAVAEDCGTMINPMIVAGQIRGGVVQGIGTALYEEIPYDETGQPLAGTLADYLLPGAAEMPAIKIGHLHTPTPHTEYGMKGMGEGGAVAPPAAIANAVRDALAASGAEVNETPITPARVMAAIRKAKEPSRT